MGMWLIAVHGRHAVWVRNIEASPHIKVKHRGRWREGVASIHPVDPARLARFNTYARGGPRTFGIDPLRVCVDLQ